MNIKEKVLIVLILLVLFSCNEDFSKNRKKIIYELELDKDDNWTKIDSFELEVNERNLYTNYYIYQFNDTTKYLWCRTLKNDSTKIIYDEDTCDFVNSIEFLVNDTVLKVRKYVYDLEHTIDEEKNIYLIQNVGIIAIKSIAWSIEKFYGDCENEILNNLVADTTGFFRINILPPPPPSDYNIKATE